MAVNQIRSPFLVVVVVDYEVTSTTITLQWPLAAGCPTGTDFGLLLAGSAAVAAVAVGSLSLLRSYTTVDVGHKMRPCK